MTNGPEGIPAGTDAPQPWPQQEPQVPPVASPPQYEAAPQYGAAPPYGAAQPPYGAGQPQYGTAPPYTAAPVRAPRPVGAPGLGITALGLGIASIVLAVVYCVLFFSSMNNLLSLGDGELFHGLSAVIGIAGLVIGIIATVQRRGRRQGAFGIALSCVGIVFPLLAQVGYLFFLLFAMAPIVFS